jgi:hypothetical protein
MKSTLLTCAVALLAVASVTASGQEPTALPRTASPANARAYLIAPLDGATVERTFTVRFGLVGMGIAPAGIAVSDTGHHHLLVDLPTLPDAAQPLPNDARHLHFGKGQTETTLTLEPGRHTLQLILGDHLHVPHQPPVVSEKITIMVE